MSDSQELSIPTSQEIAEARPDFMSGAEGTEELVQFIVPPRLKIVQPLSDAILRETFNPGDVIAQPQGLLVAEMPYDGTKATNQGTPFHFVPLFFYVEWCVWDDIKNKGTGKPVLERTLDPSSQIAAFAKNPNLWEQPHPENEKWKLRYVEHLNFVISLVNHPLAGQPMIVSFFRGEHKSGSNLALLARMRKAPLFGCQFEARCHFRSNSQGDWFGLDITNPSAGTVQPFVQSEQEFANNRQLHEQLKTAHESSLLRADYSEDTETSEPTEF